jgi:hypothetical protein
MADLKGLVVHQAQVHQVLKTTISFLKPF